MLKWIIARINDKINCILRQKTRSLELGIRSTRKKKTPLNNPEEKHCHDGNPRQAEPFRTSDVRRQAQRETEKIGLCFDICSSYNDCYLHGSFLPNMVEPEYVQQQMPDGGYHVNAKTYGERSVLHS